MLRRCADRVVEASVSWPSVSMHRRFSFGFEFGASVLALCQFPTVALEIGTESVVPLKLPAPTTPQRTYSNQVNLFSRRNCKGDHSVSRLGAKSQTCCKKHNPLAAVVSPLGRARRPPRQSAQVANVDHRATDSMVSLGESPYAWSATRAASASRTALQLRAGLVPGSCAVRSLVACMAQNQHGVAIPLPQVLHVVPNPVHAACPQE